jgi:hypothetical protein
MAAMTNKTDQQKGQLFFVQKSLPRSLPLNGSLIKQEKSEEKTVPAF